MADYIDKQKTLNVIFEIAENVINSLPSADVQPVVRCADCKYYDINECTHKLGLVAANDENYCSYGEQKDV